MISRANEYVPFQTNEYVPFQTNEYVSFQGNKYGKPRLTEPKIVKKIINTQVAVISQEQKILTFIKDFILNNYINIIIIILIIWGLYWRYNETQRKKQQVIDNDNMFNNNQTYYDSDSDSDTDTI